VLGGVKWGGGGFLNPLLGKWMVDPGWWLGSQESGVGWEGGMLEQWGEG